MRCCNLSSESMGIGDVMADTVLADTGTDEGFLLALLNSTPVIDGVPVDDLAIGHAKYLAHEALGSV